MNTVRCAIYTRKSSDEGLEQDFNSLDAQREACAAYVASQASEGWKLLPEHYDDGGISGGTLERPALQRLLADVKAGRIDIIVVYKVDRLTRSLIDFSKLVETFDEAGTSFVSVTQSFNTTTSMGRLTLNMLLSFAQFEREVTAERIRDKIAASKAKGMWMGGTPPLGYRGDGRTLAIIKDHAQIVRDIFARYLRLGNVRHVADELRQEGITSPPRVNGKGRAYGGCSFTRGQIYYMLKNPIYAGDIPHKGKVFPGNHPPIIDRDTWDTVQTRLADNVQGQRTVRQQSASLLAGLLFDAGGEPLIPVHTNKGQQRYYYYTSKVLQHGTGPQAAAGLRLPAREIEQVVRQELASLLADPLSLAQRCGLRITPSILGAVTRVYAEAEVTRSNAQLKGLVSRIIVRPDRLDFVLEPAGIAKLLKFTPTAELPERVIHSVPVRLTRTGHAVRLIQSDGAAARKEADPTLVRLLLKARRWWSELAVGNTDINTLSQLEGVTASYMTRIVRIAFLAPDIVEAILAGEARADVDGMALMATGAICPGWHDQADRFLPRQNP